MNIEDFIYILYCIPLALSMKSYQLTAEAYRSLPEKIPMNFDFKGRVNTWWPKNSFSVYLLPHISFLMIVFMCILLWVIHNDTGPMPDDFALAFWFFTFSMVYLLYQSQQGILEYSLDSTKKIWPRFNKGFFLLGLSCVGLVSLIFVNTKPEIDNAVFCTRVENNQAINIQESFSLNEQRIYLLLNLKNIKGEHLVRTEWFNPENSLHFKYQHKTHHKILAKYLPLWSYIKVNQIPAGRWSADVYIDDEKMLHKEFLIAPN